MPSADDELVGVVRTALRDVATYNLSDAHDRQEVERLLLRRVRAFLRKYDL